MVGLGRIMALRKRFMPVRVERLADNLLTLDAVLTEQLLQLLQRHLHTLMKLRGVPRCASGQSPFEIVNDWQQLDDERFFLRHRAGFAFLPAALLEIIKIGGQAQMQILLFGKILEERFRFAGCGLGSDGVGLRFCRGRVLDFSFHRLALF